MRCTGIALSMLVLAGCDCGGGDDAPDEGRSDRRSREEAPERAVEPEGPDPLGISELAITDLGWDAIPEPTRPAAMIRNERALRAHQEGDYERSLITFGRALEVSPGYDLARYNRACAMARLERHDEAARELLGLLVRDVARFRVRVEEDADLETLRASDVGRSLARATERIVELWRTAVERGVPAVAFHEVDEEEPTAVPDKKLLELRAGVYLREERRFIPVAPPIRDGRTAFVDREHDVAIVTGHGVYMTEYMYSVSRASIVGYDLVAPGRRIARLSDLNPPILRWLDEHGGLDHLYDGQYPPYRDYRVQASPDGGVIVSVRAEASRMFVRTDWRVGQDDEASFDASEPFEDDRSYVEVTAEGTRLHRATPEGWSVRGRRLTSPVHDSVPLDRGYLGATVVPAPDGNSAVLVSVTHGCVDERSRLDHRVVQVELPSGERTVLSRGHGVAAAAYAPDGTLLLQTDRAVREHPDGNVLEHVYLTTPLYAVDCEAP